MPFGKGYFIVPSMIFNAKKLKKDFPILSRKINGHPLVYLDNAATTQKPKAVIDAFKNYYEYSAANVHRGIHTLSEESSEQYENARKRVAKFLNAKSPNEIIFTRNTTEAINLVAYGWGKSNIRKDDEIITSIIEHHSNFIPWQQLCKEKRAKLKIIPLKTGSKHSPTIPSTITITPNRAVSFPLTLDFDNLEKLLTKKTRLTAITGMSNVTGEKPNLKKIIKLAHQNSTLVLIDAAQLAAHEQINVQKLDADFIAFSAHKMLGPTGLGILYAKEQLLKEMPPFLLGGGMVKEVTIKNTIFADPPTKFEAGTPNIAAAIAFTKAIDYLEKIGPQNIAKHTENLSQLLIAHLKKYPQIYLQAAQNPNGIISFTIKNIHAHDISEIFNRQGVAIRVGHHCCHPLMQELNLAATARISFYLYNTEKDIEAVEKALKKVLAVFN